MGLDHHGITFLLDAHCAGASFERTLMLGRQFLLVHPETLHGLLRRFGFDISLGGVRDLIDAHNGYADGLFRLLGAQVVETMDVSDYEGATLSHDLNEPIPADWRQRCTLLIDGGTLEHVFNVAVSFRNCMELIEAGGHFVGIGPANNQFGHGFYQFSADLYYRVFSEANGFDLERIAVYADAAATRWYSVANPDVVQRRVTLCNCLETMLLVRARRAQVVPPFQSTPQQAFYVDMWDKDSDDSVRLRWVHQPSFYNWALRHTPKFFKRLCRAVRAIFNPFPASLYHPYQFSDRRSAAEAAAAERKSQANS